MEQDDRADVLKGLASGLVGGLVASAVMNQFQKLATRLMGKDEKSHGAQSQQKGGHEHGVGKYLVDKGISDPDDTAPEKLTKAIGEAFFGTSLSDEQADTGGTIFHYAYGTVMGAMYGGAAEIAPRVTAAGGLAYGGVVWVGADEGVVPMLGLSKWPTEYPLSTHIYAVASHLVYGATTEAVRRAVRSFL